MTVLHQRGLTLGIPIERCLFINTLEMINAMALIKEKGIPDDKVLEQVLKKHPPAPVFFYFQPMSALQYQCSALG